jgi:hydrogenase maturation protein HypF
MTTFSIPWHARRVLALGGDLKCRPALAEDGAVTMLDEIGDLASPENQDALERLLAGLDPRLLVCDRHPGYYSSELARGRARERGLELCEVQHHRAHVAAVCLEWGIPDDVVVGLAFDGTGFGDDGVSWGGEFFVGSVAAGFTRRATFASLPLPGGDAAVREPWRAALALLLERDADPRLLADWIQRRRVPVRDLDLFRRGLAARIAVGRSSALGRWFDAVSALLGIGVVAAFEAEPAILLQRAAERCPDTNVLFPVEVRPGAPLTIDFPDLFGPAAATDADAPARALSFHRAAAEAVAWVADHLAEEAGTRRVIASGGCFLNGLFDRLLGERLLARRLEYRKPRILPPGDQALALGQIGLALSGRAG